MNPELLARLVCPRCRGPLSPSSDGLRLICRSEALAYPVRDGIAELLPDGAEPLAAPSS